MVEEPIIIEMNISHYRAMLDLDLDDRKRALLRRLLAEAERNLARAITARPCAGGRRPVPR